jgi:hypothetical protein
VLLDRVTRNGPSAAQDAEGPFAPVPAFGGRLLPDRSRRKRRHNLLGARCGLARNRPPTCRPSAVGVPLPTCPAIAVGQQRNWHVRKGRLAEDAVPAYVWSLDIETSQGRTTATVTLEGSLDQHSSASLRECVDEALGARAAFVVVDARGLTFVDASGLAALVRGASCGQ